ncbi:hypothetical protein C0991_008922 [Blastosporella zonata]|nr:hypothetical protein C0991_008922 [Blastosporella zonata]
MSAIHNTKAISELPAPHYSSVLPVPNPTHSFWINTIGANPLAKEGSEGDLIFDADVCIIGSGITGVSAAYHLAKNFAGKEGIGLKVAILEARDFCECLIFFKLIKINPPPSFAYRFWCNRSVMISKRRPLGLFSAFKGRNGGHLTPYIFNNFLFRESRYGSEEAKKAHKLEIHTEQEMVNLIKAEGWEKIVDLVSNYRVGLLRTDKEIQTMKADYEAAKAAKADNLEYVEWLSEKKAFELYGSSHQAYRYPGNNVWPLKLVTQLYKLARKLNPDLKLYTNTYVTSISRSSTTSRRWSLSTPRGDVQCSYVIHATNGYASHLLPHMHGPKGIVPTRGQAIALRASASASEITKDAWVAALGWKYWFPRPVHSADDHPLVIVGGGRDESGPGLELYIADDSTVNADIGKALRNYLPPLFPGKYADGREPEMEWTGIMGCTHVGDPFVGPVVDAIQTSDYYKGQYIAAGYTGHGMPRAYACAEVVADMIIAEITGKKWAAPEWFPSHFMTTERL